MKKIINFPIAIHSLSGELESLTEVTMQARMNIAYQNVLLDLV